MKPLTEVRKLSESQTLSLYKTTVCRGKRNKYHLELIFGDGPKVLKYQGFRGQRPGYHYSPDNPRFLAYSFSEIKKFIEPFFYPDMQEKLQAWREKMGDEADRICKEAIEVGNMVHKMLANYAHNQALGPCTIDKMPYKQALQDDILPHFDQDRLEASLTDHDGDVLPLSEVFVADFQNQFIGGLDLITRITTKPFDHQRVLLELKASRNPKKIEYMHPHIVQATALQSTFNKLAEIFPDLEPLDGVAVAYVYSQGNGDLVPIAGEELQEYEQEWQQWLAYFHNQFAVLNAV